MKNTNHCKEYQLYLELKEKYGEFETEEQFWANQKLSKVEKDDTVLECPF